MFGPLLVILPLKVKSPYVALSMTPLNCRNVLNSPPNFQTWRPFAHVNASSYEKSRSSLRIPPAVVEKIDNARDAEGLLAYAMNGEPCQRPSVFARYSTIAVASASDACAPRATIARTIASHSFSLMRWLVTTSME